MKPFVPKASQNGGSCYPFIRFEFRFSFKIASKIESLSPLTHFWDNRRTIGRVSRVRFLMGPIVCGTIPPTRHRSFTDVLWLGWWPTKHNGYNRNLHLMLENIIHIFGYISKTWHVYCVRFSRACNASFPALYRRIIDIIRKKDIRYRNWFILYNKYKCYFCYSRRVTRAAHKCVSCHIKGLFRLLCDAEFFCKW